MECASNASAEHRSASKTLLPKLPMNSNCEKETKVPIARVRLRELLPHVSMDLAECDLLARAARIFGHALDRFLLGIF